jgi:16S rRNA G966 N2-methylase RsmD
LEKIEQYSFLKDCSDELQEAFFLKKKNHDFELDFHDENLTLTTNNQSVFCDFVSAKYLTEVRQNYSRAEGVYAFLKTLTKNHERLSILDMTAGLGRDLFKFVLAGHKVTAFEQDPVLYLVLRDGVKRFLKSKDREKIKKQFKLNHEFHCDLHFGDSVQYLKDSNAHFDLIYFDPMFEDSRKKAAPKKHMQIIKELVLQNYKDKETVLLEALNRTNTLVLKSSTYAGTTLKPKRELSFKGFSYFIFND